MDNIETTQSSSDQPKIELTRESLIDLYETGGWAQFLAILGFIFCGLFILIALTVGSFMPDTMADGSPFPFPMKSLSLMYVVIAVLYFLPVYYLYSFASNTRLGIRQRDATRIATALRNLKSHYKFVGIMTIVMIALYILFILLFVALGAGKMLGGSVNT